MFLFNSQIRASSLGWVRTAVRFAPAPLEKHLWKISDTHKAVFVPRDGRVNGAVRFAQDALKAQTSL
jgi:hypothetical protein